MKPSRVSWVGAAILASAAINRLSLFPDWAPEVGDGSAKVSKGSDAYASSFDLTKATVPTKGEGMAARANQQFTKTVAMGMPSTTSVVDSLNGAVAPLRAASAVLRTDGQNFDSSVEI